MTGPWYYEEAYHDVSRGPYPYPPYFALRNKQGGSREYAAIGSREVAEEIVAALNAQANK